MPSSRVWQWRDAVADSDICASYKHVLLILSFPMNSEGENAWPSIETLCRRTSLSRPTVIRYLTQARQDGWLKRRSRGKHMSFEYTATFPKSKLVIAPSKTEPVCEVKSVNPNSPINSPPPLSPGLMNAGDLGKIEKHFEQLLRIWPQITESQKRQARDIWHSNVLLQEQAALMRDAEDHVARCSDHTGHDPGSLPKYIYEWLSRKSDFSQKPEHD